MPNLTDVNLPIAFKYKKDVTITGSAHFIPLSQIDIGALQRLFPNVRERVVNEIKVKREVKPQVNPSRSLILTSKNDWERMDGTSEIMNVSDNSCNEEEIKELDLSGFVNLRELKVGKECFEKVNEVRLMGLNELESVEIGMNSFTKQKNGFGNNPNRHFYLKDCPKMKSLKMGDCSFSDYTVLEIENVDALEVIEMDGSFNFDSASLELKSILVQIE